MGINEAGRENPFKIFYRIAGIIFMNQINNFPRRICY